MDPILAFCVEGIRPKTVEQAAGLLMVRPEWASRCNWNWFRKKFDKRDKKHGVWSELAPWLLEWRVASLVESNLEHLMSLVPQESVPAARQSLLVVCLNHSMVRVDVKKIIASVPQSCREAVHRRVLDYSSKHIHGKRQGHIVASVWLCLALFVAKQFRWMMSVWRLIDDMDALEMIAVFVLANKEGPIVMENILKAMHPVVSCDLIGSLLSDALEWHRYNGAFYAAARDHLSQWTRRSFDRMFSFLDE